MSRSELYVLEDYATLDLVTDDTADPTPVAGIQDVEVIPSESIETFYSADSTKPADKMSHEKTVQVDIGYSFFDGEVAKQWLGGAGTSTGEWEDTSDPQLYELTGTFMSRDGSQQLDFTVEGISFEEMPLIAASRGEYAQWDLSGEGMDITGFDVDAPPA